MKDQSPSGGGGCRKEKLSKLWWMWGQCTPRRRAHTLRDERASRGVRGRGFGDARGGVGRTKTGGLGPVPVLRSYSCAPCLVLQDPVTFEDKSMCLFLGKK